MLKTMSLGNGHTIRVTVLADADASNVGREIFRERTRHSHQAANTDTILNGRAHRIPIRKASEDHVYSQIKTVRATKRRVKGQL